VSGTSVKTNIIKDFAQKKTIYYDRNYRQETRFNYLRRLRCSLITEHIDLTRRYDYVLDIGCGPAILFPDLLKMCNKYFAVDLVWTNLDQIKRDNRNGNIECIKADLDTFNWQENYFDIIICSGSIEYTREPEVNLLKLIRFLKNDGMLICSFPNAVSPYCWWREYVYKYISYAKNKLVNKAVYSYPRKLFKLPHVQNLIADHCNHSVIVNYFGYKFIPEPFNYLLSRFDYKLTRHFQENPKNWLKKYCTEFLIVLTTH